TPIENPARYTQVPGAAPRPLSIEGAADAGLWRAVVFRIPFTPNISRSELPGQLERGTGVLTGESKSYASTFEIVSGRLHSRWASSGATTPGTHLRPPPLSGLT